MEPEFLDRIIEKALTECFVSAINLSDSYETNRNRLGLLCSVIQSVALWLGLLLPSVSILQQFFGSIGIGIYCIGAASGIWVSRLALRISERSCYRCRPCDECALRYVMLCYVRS